MQADNVVFRLPGLLLRLKKEKFRLIGENFRLDAIFVFNPNCERGGLVVNFHVVLYDMCSYQ